MGVGASHNGWQSGIASFGGGSPFSALTRENIDTMIDDSTFRLYAGNIPEIEDGVVILEPDVKKCV